MQKILEDNGFGPPGGGRTWEEYPSAAKDAWWALDSFVVRTLHGQLLQVMAITNVHTRELLGLRAHDGWDVDSLWTMRTLAIALGESKRRPTAVILRARAAHPSEDNDHCGGCNQACDVPRSCLDGVCSCPNGLPSLKLLACARSIS